MAEKREIDYYEELCAMVKQLHGDTDKLKTIYDAAQNALSDTNAAIAELKRNSKEIEIEIKKSGDATVKECKKILDDVILHSKTAEEDSNDFIATRNLLEKRIDDIEKQLQELIKKSGSLNVNYANDSAMERKNISTDKGNSITVRQEYNEEKNGIQLIFSSAPGDDVCNELRSHGFRYYRPGRYWYKTKTIEADKFAKEFCSAFNSGQSMDNQPINDNYDLPF